MIEGVAKYRVEERLSQKSGKNYFVLVVEFEKGYVSEFFIDRDKKYLIELNTK